MPPRLAVVIPAYDEALRLGSTLQGVLDYLGGRGESFEVIVVDDGSRDATAEVAERFAPRGVRLVRLPENRGKGAAVRAGCAASTADRVLVSDADLSTPIEELAVLERELERGRDLVIGSRAVAGSRVPVRQPWYRELAGKTFNLLVRIGGVGGIHDTQCGFKLMEGEPARALARELTIDRFAWDVELIWLARRRGMSVAEVGVEWRNDPATRVRLVRDSLRMLIDILRFRWRHRGAGEEAR